MTAQLDPMSSHIVLINTFHVAPEKAEKLVDLLENATEEVMKRQPGFVSANLHVSEDRKRIINYAQWRTKEDLAAMQKNPEARTHMEEAAKLATSFEPVLYDLLYSAEAA